MKNAENEAEVQIAPRNAENEAEAGKVMSRTMSLATSHPMGGSSGQLSCRTKAVLTAPTLGFYALRYVKLGYMKKFYTDDYPRASLSVLSTFLILSTLLDLIFDPTLAGWTDGLRSVFGRDWGRRKPFLFVASFLVTISYAMAFAPPASFSAKAQEDSEAWFAANGNTATAPVFNSVASAVWFGIFHIAVKVFSDAIFEIPHGALLVEVTHDGKERTSVWSWREIFLCFGILVGMVVPIIGENECSSSPETGCYSYLMISLAVGLIFTISTLFLCWDIKERPASNVPGPVEALVPSIVGCFSNFPYMILLISDLVEGFGANLPLLVLPYVVDWVVGPQAATDLVGSPGMLFAACVVVHMVVRLPVTFVWKWAAGRFGKYHTFLAFNIMYGVYMFAFLAVTKGQALLSIILCGLWGIAYGGHWLLLDLCSDVIDYDELVTGRRREGQFTMARDLVPKICEIPADALPFLLMSYFQYNPDLAEQPEEVQWIIRGSFSIVPGLAGLLGTVVLFWFTLRTNEQHEQIINGIIDHQAGLSVTDPLTGLLLPPIKPLSDGSVEYSGSIVGAQEIKILEHFFASEIAWACDSQNVGRLKIKPLIYLVISLLLVIPGVFLTIEGWPALSNGESSWAPVGIILLGFAFIGSVFSAERIRQGIKAHGCVQLKDLEVMKAIHQSRGRIPGGQKVAPEEKVQEKE